MARRFDRDLLNMLPVQLAATTTMSVIDHLQDFTPEAQIAAVTASFKLLTERFGVDPQDAFSVTDNIMNHAEGTRVEFNAVRAYLANEV